MLPSAHYEMAVLSWTEKDLQGVDARAKVLDCEQWLDKAKTWPEQFILDTRMSVKIGTSVATLKRHRRIMGW